MTELENNPESALDSKKLIDLVEKGVAEILAIEQPASNTWFDSVCGLIDAAAYSLFSFLGKVYTMHQRFSFESNILPHLFSIKPCLH